MVDFKFYLNKQGIRGPRGEKGDTGYSPVISEAVNTLSEYRLRINNEFDSFVTDNLRGNDYFDETDPNGTYLRYNKDLKRAYTGSLDQATSNLIGGARIANDEDMSTFSENTIVTPALFADNLSKLIVSTNNYLSVSQDELTSKTKITFNDSTLNAIRADLTKTQDDLRTSTRELNNQINAESRERVSAINDLREWVRDREDGFVTLDSNQTITGRKTFGYIKSKGIDLLDNLGGQVGSIGTDFSSISLNPEDGTRIFIGNQFATGSKTYMSGDVEFSGGNIEIAKGTNRFKLLSQNTVEAGDNITVENTTNGIKISSTASAGAIIDDGDPATDKVYSSSKTSDLVGELGNEVNSIAGRLNTLEGEVRVATTENLGLVQPDGTTITINSDGKISAVGGGSGVEIDNNTIRKNSNNQIYATGTIRSAKSSTHRIMSDGTEFIMSNKSVPTDISISPLGEVAYSQLVFEDGSGDVNPLVAFDTIKAGTNMEIVKNVNNGIITFNCIASTPEVDNVTIEVNEEGKLQTTVDINELQAKVEDLQLYKFPNATIEGDPTINNGQISNFSVTNYLKFPFEFKTEGRTWLLNGSFDTDSDVVTQQNIIDSLASVALAVRNGKLILALSTNGTSFDLGEHESMSDIEPNTKYYYRLSFSGAQYLLSISTDKQEWLPEIIVASDQPIASKPMTISSSGHPFKGTINLNDYDLTVANVVVWQGMDDVGIASRLDVNASNITQSGIDHLIEVLGIGNIGSLLDVINGEVIE